MLFRTFFGSIAVTVATLAAAAWFGGPTALSLVAILAILEVSLSFDNAVINASVLVRMSRFWQRIFLTIGILIAVFGMRLVFPLVLVAVTAELSPLEAFRLAVEHPDQYQHTLEEAHPSIAAFGGVFLLMIFLDFVFEERQIRWLHTIETALARIGKLDQFSVVLALGALLLVAGTIADDPETVLISGAAGLLTYLIVNGLGNLFAAGETAAGAGARGVVGKAAFFLFLYLEVLDASFSFDGVVGAFAISSNIIIIAAGLGIGAMYVRSITVFLVNRGTLSEYVYLEHGAHWAIGSLAVVLLATIRFHVNEVITGLIGVAFIALAYTSSVARNRRNRRPAADEHDRQPDSIGA
ncbi:MAG: DUF475 domain-containing protein [Dactylosporangium sp.]|nr:DUF475 domain-containing protein [Dactylosporangium sp.]NNJ62685.1 DUF475 domain-containing protein [Dactylosporangium sp.]